MKRQLKSSSIKMDLIQPRHTYATRDKTIPGHIYLPTSLLTEGARLLEAEVEVRFHDENIRAREISSRNIGINLLGAPYIPQVIQLQRGIEPERGADIRYFLGGQVVSGLTADQIARLFGTATYNGNNDEILTRLLGIYSKLVSPEQTSLVPAYEKISDADMKEYLSREFSLYVSQGCKFRCDFCAAGLHPINLSFPVKNEC